MGNLYCTLKAITMKNIQNLTLRNNVMKINGMPHPISLTKPRGILKEKLNSILQSLSQVLPANRKIFLLVSYKNNVFFFIN